MMTVSCIFMPLSCYSALEYVFINKWRFTNDYYYHYLLLIFLKSLINKQKTKQTNKRKTKQNKQTKKQTKKASKQTPYCLHLLFT